MTNSQNPEPVESAAGWVRAPQCPSRGRYLLIGLICLALVVGVFVVAHGKSAAATRRHQARRQPPSSFERGRAATFPRYQPRR
jgi:hypothetical protein